MPVGYGSSTCAMSTSAGVSRPNILTLSLTLKLSVSMPSTRPIKPSRGRRDLHGIADVEIDGQRSRLLDAHLLHFLSGQGTGFEAGPTKPVQPRVLRTTYQVSSFMTILTRT